MAFNYPLRCVVILLLSWELIVAIMFTSEREDDGGYPKIGKKRNINNNEEVSSVEYDKNPNQHQQEQLYSQRIIKKAVFFTKSSENSVPPSGKRSSSASSVLHGKHRRKHSHYFTTHSSEGNHQGSSKVGKRASPSVLLYPPYSENSHTVSSFGSQGVIVAKLGGGKYHRAKKEPFFTTSKEKDVPNVGKRRIPKTHPYRNWDILVNIAGNNLGNPDW